MNQFEVQADKWWKDGGPFDLLHKMNPIRLKYIKDHIGDTRGKKAIDIGCGGGILTMPMTRMGIEVTGLDTGKKNIEVAIAKSKAAELDIKYIAKFFAIYFSNYHLTLFLYEKVQAKCLSLIICKT